MSKRVLIAWELGANYGHLAQCLSIALALRERGHEVVFAVQDIHGAAELFSGMGFQYCQAPLPSERSRLARAPANYSEMLLGQGYGDHSGLKAMLSAWLALYQAYRVDVILAEHAPTAVLAGLMAQVPVIPIGNGFAVPPPVYPLPSIRPWESIANTRLQAVDRQVHQVIAQVLAEFGAVPLRICDLFGKAAMLATFPELDHYGVRTGANYIGPISTAIGSHSVTWQHSGGRKVIAYLRPGTMEFGPWLHALQTCGAEVIAVLPGMSAAKLKHLATPMLRLFSSPIAFSGVLEEADLLVSHGGSGSLTELLLAGIPQLVIPRYVEQLLMARRVEILEAGMTINMDRRQEVCATYIRRLLDEEQFKCAAMKFARKYASYQMQSAVMKVVAAIEMAVVP